MDILHIPVLRQGKVYESLNKVDVIDHRTAAVLARISQANAGLIRRDLRKLDQSQQALQRLSCQALLDIFARAGELFMNADLPLFDEGATQTPQQYIEALWATSGIPFNLVRNNMEKIHHVFVEMPTILRGLTRGMDLTVIDEGLGFQDGIPVSFYPTTSALAVVLPSNSPGVNSLWMPAVALKIPVVLKPGGQEPWTPCRIIQALIAAGCPAEAFSYYSADHEGAAAVMDTCRRALIFGGEDTVKRYENNPAVQVHGPGWSKVIIGEDEIDRWPDYIDILIESILANGGRSCINASAVIVPAKAKEIAEALGERLGRIEPCDPSDDKAALSAFANTKMADFIDETISEGLKTSGAEDVTAKYRTQRRKVEYNGSTFLLPTVIRCDTPDHPLANREFLYPYASVLEVPQENMIETIGSSLVVTAITEDQRFIRSLLSSTLIDRVNLGPIPTTKVQWDQPHEGNLFDFLYKRRSIQKAAI